MRKTITSSDRDRVKSLVPTGNAKQIQVAMDTGLYKRKAGQAVEVDETAKVMIFTATTDTLDRDSERVLPRSFENDMGYYKENPIVLYGHDHRLPAVGKTVDYKFSDKSLMMTVDFAVDENPMSALLWNLYANDYMRMVSVGFIPLEWSDDKSEKLAGQEGLTFTRNEMIELSLVNVGSNRYALSELPTEIKGDPLMADTYARMIEGDTAHKTKSIISATEFIAFPETIGGLPINLNVSVSDNGTTEIEPDMNKVSAESTKAKFYGMLSGMFPESYEERQQAIYENLMDYLEYMLEGIGKHEYVETTQIATFDDHVIVYCWNTNKIYKASYEVSEGEVDFVDLTEIELVYEEMPIEAKRLANIYLPKREKIA